MSVNSNRKRPIGQPLVSTQLTSGLMCEKAFTIAELMIVIVIIGMLLGITTIVWQSTERSFDLQSSAEMFKADIRKVSSMAAAGTPNKDALGRRHRDQYMLEINTGAGSPPNCYRIRTRTWSGSAYGEWTDPPPGTVRSAEANKIVTDADNHRWIKPSNFPDMKITVEGSTEGTYPLIFEAKGSIVQVMDPTAGTAPATGGTVIRLSTSSKTINITVSAYGDIS